jgi:hypothetical protein
MSFLAIPEPAKIPNELWSIEIATAKAAKTTDKRIKTIFEKCFVFVVPVGSMIKGSSGRLTATALPLSTRSVANCLGIQRRRKNWGIVCRLR